MAKFTEESQLDAFLKSACAAADNDRSSFDQGAEELGFEPNKLWAAIAAVVSGAISGVIAFFTRKTTEMTLKELSVAILKNAKELARQMTSHPAGIVALIAAGAYAGFKAYERTALAMFRQCEGREFGLKKGGKDMGRVMVVRYMRDRMLCGDLAIVVTQDGGETFDVHSVEDVVLCNSEGEAMGAMDMFRLRKSETNSRDKEWLKELNEKFATMSKGSGTVGIDDREVLEELNEALDEKSKMEDRLEELRSEALDEKSAAADARARLEKLNEAFEQQSETLEELRQELEMQDMPMQIIKAHLILEFAQAMDDDEYRRLFENFDAVRRVDTEGTRKKYPSLRPLLEAHEERMERIQQEQRKAREEAAKAKEAQEASDAEDAQEDTDEEGREDAA